MTTINEEGSLNCVESAVKEPRCALTVSPPADIWTVIPPNMTDVKLVQGPMW